MAKKTVIEIPPKLHQRLKAMAVKEKTTLYEMAEKVITAGLAK